MKITASDAVGILRLFNEGSESIQPRLIDQLKVTHPTPHTTLAFFRYQKQTYVSIIDVTAEDDTHYLLNYILAEKPGIVGEFVVSSNDDSLASYAAHYKGKDVYLFKVTTNKKRLDLVLNEQHPQTSRSTWQKYIKTGYVMVNNLPVLSPKQEVTTADTITVNIPKATDYSGDSLPILYQDDNVIVINKPVGVLTHSKGALNDEFTVADFFRRYTTYNLETNRPGIVHRLDRDTSGVLIGARNAETAHLLQKQFADRNVKKTYLAILDGILKQKEAEVQLPIARHPSAPSTFRVDSKGKSATTHYHVNAEKNGKTLVELRPFTGRTHQLRVHMQYLGSPIYGDRVYGKPAERLYLHAWKLEITIPKGQRKIFIAPVPPEFYTLFPENNHE